jgi:chemotaxis protein MotC
LLAYSRGISEADKTWLAEIDPRSLAPRGAAHLALRPGNADCGGAIEQGDLLSGSGPHLAPGTLLEEAALRRETVITALMEDFEKFEMLSSQYLRRFGDSVYAPEFTGRFAVAVATGRYAEDDAVLQGAVAHARRARRPHSILP